MKRLEENEFLERIKRLGGISSFRKYKKGSKIILHSANQDAVYDVVDCFKPLSINAKKRSIIDNTLADAISHSGKSVEAMQLEKEYQDIQNLTPNKAKEWQARVNLLGADK